MPQKTMIDVRNLNLSFGEGAKTTQVLTGMAKRIAPDAEATPLNTPADLEAFAKSL